MKYLKILTGLICFCVITFALGAFLYIKVLPCAIGNKKVLNFIEKTGSKIMGAQLTIKKPSLKTEWSPYVNLKFDEISLKKENKNLLDVKDFDSRISLAKIFKKQLIIENIKTDNIYANISGIMDLPPFKQTQPTQNGFNVDIFKSKADIKNLDAFYQIDKENSVKLNAKNVKISENPNKKYLSYDLKATLMRDKSKLDILAKESGENTIIENKERLVIKDSNLTVDKAKVLLNGAIDIKNYDLNFKSKNFKVKDAIDILDSQIVKNNLSDNLVYFKNIGGDFDFDVNVNNKGINGNMKLNKLSFDLIPFNNLPVILNSGKVDFDNNKINLKDFKGFYDGKTYNKMDFEGSIKDYIKSVDTNLIGNAVITNDFGQKYLSKMVGYPLQIRGKADTRIILKSKYNKFDITWLYKFEKGNGFLFDGEEAFINNEAIRVLVAKMHLADNLLAIKSLDYHIARQDPKDKRRGHTPILSMNGNIDLSGGKQVIKDLGLTLTRPMPSGFVNMLVKQNLFKNGTFTGFMRYVNTGKTPVLEGDFQVNEVAVPSQRLFIKKGVFKTDKENMNIIAQGGYRRSKYNINAKIKNELIFPIIVRDADLEVDNMDVERYLQAFNNQNPSDNASENVSNAISKSLEQEVDEDSDTPTFDLANLIVEKCTMKVKKGNYKKIDFANVIGNLTLDKNSILKLDSNRFDIAEGQAEAKVNCDLKKHLYNLTLAVIKVNSDTLATELVNLPKEIKGKASGIINLNTDKTLKLNGNIKFVINNGEIAKIGLIEYTMKVAALFRNPIVMITPSVVSDLVDIPEGKFDRINGDLTLERNVVRRLVIKSVSPQLSTYIIGRYNLDNQDAILRVYTRFSNRSKGAYGFLRSLSLNTLANRIPFSSRNNSNYYEAEIKELPKIEVDDKDTQIFLTKVDGDIIQNNFLSSLHKIK